jgi:hypothetical protein
LDPDASKICTIILSLGIVLPQDLTMEMTGSPDDYIVGANGIPKRKSQLTLMTSSASLEAVLKTK